MNEQFREIWRITRGLICSAVAQTDLPADSANLSPETLREVYALSAKFDLAHLIAVPLLKEQSPDQVAVEPFRQAMYRAVNRYVQMDYEIGRIGEVFERENIPYLPLKGAAMRQYYPEPWMRPSCDVDILVHESDLSRAIDSLKASLSYVQTGRTAHDVSLNAGKVHLELHYDTIEGDRAAASNQVLSHIWDHASPAEGCRYVLDDAMFDFYHIAHMAKHFENGGCGVRPFLDLWILNHRLTFDWAKRESLLLDGGLLKFAEGCEALSEVWFGEAEPDELTDRLEQYILGGGMYGNIENMVAVQRNQDGGRIRYIFKRLFMPYEKLKNVYPILQRHKCLTPIIEIRRWIKMITDGRMNRTVRDLQGLKSGGGVGEIENLLRELGL